NAKHYAGVMLTTPSATPAAPAPAGSVAGGSAPVVEELDGTGALANALRPAVMRLARRLRQMRDDSLNLNSNQLSAMAVLLNSGDQLMGELAAAEKVQPPSMTRIVNGLEERGYVVRRPDDRDRRQCRVALTGAGREVLLDNRRRRDEWLAGRLDELTPDEHDLLRRCVGVLDKVNHA
ncbi:MAG: MarR family transcriptional regulator, partial [Friedmanniella sp.]|nr:MarR family transcriptional regulator [Friedmanniella sp.]